MPLLKSCSIRSEVHIDAVRMYGTRTSPATVPPTNGNTMLSRICMPPAQALEAIKLAAGIGTPLARRLLIADALSACFSIVQLRAR